MKNRIIAAVLLAAGTAATAQVVRFDGQRAVRVTVTSIKELRTVQTLADEILTCEGSGVGTFDIRVTPEHYAALVVSGIRHTVMIPDIQAHLDQIWADDARIRATDDPAWFATYRTLAEFDARTQFYATNYPTLATRSQIGTSVQSRPIYQLRVTGPGDATNRPAIVVQANQHAREWITPHAAMYMIDRFCETYATDNRIKNIVDKIDFYFIVSTNPDGYEYSRLTNASWRKNRRSNTGTGCTGTFGVDLNRNWGYQWGFDNLGSSGTCSSDTYRGTAAFSEPELAGLKTLVDTLAAQGKLRAHLDLHTNGQAILSPWGFRTSPAPVDLPLMNTLGQMMQTAMQSVRGTVYPYGQGSVILYLANGCTRDYTYGVHGRMAWTIELGGASFQPPVSEILPICQEALAGLLPLAEYYIPPAPVCYANCDASTTAPILNALDFGCFLSAFAAGQSYANCDNSTTAPTLNALDFGCFLSSFAAGCS